MSTIELQNILKTKISSIEDNSFLQFIDTVLDNRNNALDDYNLDILMSESDIKNGNVFSHNQVLEKIEQWKKR